MTDSDPRPVDASFRSILAATDLAEGSDEVVRAAAGVAAHSGGALHVVHSADVHSASDARAGRTFEERVAEAGRKVAAQIGRAVPGGVRVEQHVGSSAPDREIMEHAARVGADLIVVGPHARQAGSAGLLGSTAQRVLSGAGAPCLVVRMPLQAPLYHVVAAVDPDHQVESVLDAALRWTVMFGNRGSQRFSALYVTGDRSGEPPPLLENAVRSALARSGAPDQLDARIAMRGTDVVESILLFAEAEAGDLLVLSSRNRGLLGRALLGSVSAEVTRRAPCNVLLVPPRPGS